MSKLRLGKQRTVRGAYSHNFIESRVTGLDRDGYNPSNNPTMAGGNRNTLRPAGSVNADQPGYGQIGKEGSYMEPGFSGPIGRANNHPKSGGRTHTGAYSAKSGSPK